MRKFFFIILLLGHFHAPAQKSWTIDSLIRAYSAAGSETEKWQCLYDLGTYYIPNHRDSAMLFVQQALDLAKASLPSKLPQSYSLLGNLHTEYKAYEKASEALFHALELSETSGCEQCKTEVLNRLFLISYDRLDFEKALGFLARSRRIAQQIGDSTALTKSFINTGLVYSQIPQNDSAIWYIEQGIALSEALNNISFLQFCYNNLGIVYQNTGQHRKSLDQFKKAAHYAQIADNKEMQATLIFNMGSSFEELLQYDSALQHLEQAKLIMDELNRDDLLAYYYEGAAQIQKKQGRYKAALDNYEISVALNDSLRSELYGKNISEAETKFRTQEIAAQLANRELQLSRQTAVRNRIIGLGLISILLVGGVLQFFRQRDRLRKKEAEMALQLEYAESEKLREMDQLKSRFFANISHEFRTPLTLIQGPLQTIGRQKETQGSSEIPVPAKYIRIMSRNVDRLLHLVQQLLDLSKLESGKMQLSASKLDITKLVSVLAFSFESLADRKQIDYRVSFPSESVVGWCDADKLEKVLVNLLSNAFKFTQDEGSIELNMKLLNPERLQISVSDTGVGIPEEELPHIFERFYSRATNKVSSTGIGLALTKELTELQHGQIEVQSEEDRGSTFTFTLPFGKSHLRKEEIASEITVVVPGNAGQPPPVEANFEKLNAPSKIDEQLPQVLIVEDHFEVRQYIADQLADHYQIHQAVDGREGLYKTLEIIPDLIISDVMMPQMDGYEFCEKIKADERSSHIPIILLTALAEQADKLEGLESGADSYLAKPFDPDELRLRVRKLIEQRKKLQQRYQNTILQLKPKEISVASKDEQFLKNLILAVEEHMEDEEFSVIDLARTAALSRHQLHRKLKALTGHSISVFIRRLRLERAHQLLEQGAGNSSEVCFMVGFSSPAYFSKCFKDYFGKVPREVYGNS